MSIEASPRIDEKGRMNVLLIICDQLRRDHLGYVGDPIVSTPNIDELAAQGTDFTRTYTCVPTCAPNRASLFTARMPSAHGLRVNGMSLKWDTPTVTKALADAGYETHLVGKSHLQPYGIGPGDKTIEMGTGAYFPDTDGDGADYTHEFATRSRAEYVDYRDYYGWQGADMTLQHGDFVQGHYYWWLKDKGIAWEEVVGVKHALATDPDWPSTVYKPSLPEDLYPTAFVQDRTIAALREYARRGKPFFLTCSFPDPHHPFTPPGKYWGRHAPADMPLPKTFDDPAENAPPHIRSMKDAKGDHRDPYLGFAPSEAQYKAAMAAQYGQIEMIDDAVGEIVRAVRELGLEDDTAIIFTSDHGDMFGDHGLMLKHCMHDDAMVRVPLVVKVPGRAQSVNDGFAMTMDIGATVLELAGLGTITGQQGRSLLDGVGDPARTVRESAYIEEELPYRMDGLEAPIRMRTVVTDKGRMTVYAGESFGELFDLVNDPDELHNLWGQPGSEELYNEMMTALARDAMATDPNDMVPRYLG